MSAHSPDTIGPFRVEALIGHGGMGDVYRCRRSDGTLVALKVLRDAASRTDEARRFDRESRIRIEHPNVVQILDAGCDEEIPWIALELLEGRTLRQRLHEGPLLPHEAQRVITAVCEGVAAAHVLGIVHRDLKPSNVFLCDDGTVKVLDFGVARWAPHEADITIERAVIGTPDYLSPEQARADRDIDERADVWSVGVMLFECLTGQRPFRRDSAIATLLAVTLEEAPSLLRHAPRIDPEFAAVVGRALSKVPEQRFAAITSLSEAIAALDPTLREAPSDESPTAIETPKNAPQKSFVSLMYLRHTRSRRRAQRVIRELGGDFLPVGGRDAVGVFGLRGYRGDEPDRAVLAALRMGGQAGRRAVTVGRVVAGVASISGDALKIVQASAELDTDAVIIDEASARLLKEDYGARKLTQGRRALFAPRPITREAVPSETLLVGREAELAALGRAIRTVKENVTSAGVVIVGPVGMGKSRLRRIAAEEFERFIDGAIVLEARASPRHARAFSSLTAAIDGCLRACAPRSAYPTAQEWIRIALSSLGLELTEADAVSRKMAPVIDRHVDDRALLAQADSAAPQPEALRHFFGALASIRPVLLCIDDVQWADRESLETVCDLLGLLDDTPFLLMMTGRLDAGDRLPAALESDRRIQRIEPQPLLRNDVGDLAAAMLGSRPSEEVLDRIVSRCGGNPLFVDAALRALAHGGSRGDQAPSVPVTVEAAVHVRLGALTDSARRVCDVLTILPDGVDAAELRGFGLRDVEPTLKELTRIGLVVHRGRRGASTERSIRLRVSMIGEVAYASLGDDRRAELHGLAVAVIEARGGAHSEDLGFHSEEAGRSSVAAAHYAEGAVQAAALSDWETALRCAQAALRLAPTVRGFELRLMQARAKYWCASTEELAAALDEAEGAAVSDEEVAHVLSARLTLAMRLREVDVGLEHAARALELVEAGAHSALSQRVLLNRAVLLVIAGRLGEAQGAVTEVLSSLSEESPLYADALDVSAYLDMSQMNLWSAREKVQAAVRGHRKHGNVARALRGESNMSDLLNRLGAYDEAVVALEQIVEECRDAGLPVTRGYGIANLAYSHLQLGNRRRAGVLLLEAAEIAAAFGVEGLTRVVRLYDAMAHLRAGENATARRLAEEVLADASVSPRARTEALTIVAHSLLEEGRDTEALGLALEAEALHEEVGSMSEGELELFAVLERALRANGRADEADGARLRREDRVRSTAAAIPDAAYRSRYLQAARLLIAPGGSRPSEHPP